MRTYKIFVIFHDKIDMSYFAGADLDHFCFVNVNPANRHRYPLLHVLNLFELPRFIPLGKWYTESEVIYNVYKHPELTAGCDFIGFIHYDIDFTPVTQRFLETSLSRYELINFQPMPLQKDFDQQILMDPGQPDTLQGPGKNCYVTILQDFNSFYHTGYAYQQYMECDINLCSCFLIRQDKFSDMMRFAGRIIESGKLNAFDRRHKHRIQGGFMERYYAVWGLLKVSNTLNFPLKHAFVQTRKNQPFLRKLRSFLFSSRTGKGKS